MIPKRTNVLLENKYNKQKKLCHDNFQLAQVKMKKQKSIFLYNWIQIERTIVELEANLKAPQNLINKKLDSKTYTNWYLPNSNLTLKILYVPKINEIKPLNLKIQKHKNKNQVNK